MPETIIQQIPLDRIICGKQVREHFDEESLGGLTQSLRENGLHEPIHVTKLDGERYALLTGGRRVRAARKAGWSLIPAIVEKAELAKKDVVVRQLLENVQREDLKPLEKARGIDLLMKETGWNASQTAAKLGLTNGTITKLLSLLTLPEAIQQKVQNGELPATAAYELTHVANEAEREALASRVVKGELNRDELSGSIKSEKRNRLRKNTPRRRKMQITAKLPDRRSITVSAPNLDLTVFVEILAGVLAAARQAQTEQLALPQFLKRIKEGQGNAPVTASPVDSPAIQSVSAGPKDVGTAA